MNDFSVRNYWGDKAANAFDKYVNSKDGWSSRHFGMEERYSSADLKWIRDKYVSNEILDEFREYGIELIGKARFDKFYKRVNGKLPIPIRWEADRLLLYKDEIVAAVDVKSKGPRYENWAVEVMALIANAQGHLRYGCPVFYAFPPKDFEADLYGYWDFWTIAKTQELTDIFRTQFKDGSFSEGSGTPFHTIWQQHVKTKLVDYMIEVENAFDSLDSD